MQAFLKRFFPGAGGFLSVLLPVVLIGACVQNPVTGKKELLLVSESWELQVGKQQYLPLRQSQGGDYVVDPGVEAYVKKVGQRLAAKSDRKLPYEFNVINSSVPNAWALPGGKISINRGLLTALKSEAELAAVLGHEIVHAAAKHGARGQTRGLALQTLVMTASIAGAKKGYGELAQMGSTIGAQIVNSQYGRKAELESDRYGMEYMARAGYSTQGAVDLQRTFVKLSEGQKSDWLSGLFSSHPPSQARVKANIATGQKLPSGGNVGADRYRKVMARLFKTQTAYENFDKAQKALAAGKRQEAMTLARKAIRGEPREGHFYSFVGDIAHTQKDYRSAKKNYDKAISLNSEFFYYYLQRGKVNDALRQTKAARSDYARSLKLMPTSDAQTALGRFAERDGNRQAAQRFYSLAAQAGGKAGEQARSALLRLNPQNALTVRKGTTRKGTLAFEVINQTSQPVSNVVLGITTGPGQRVQQKKLRGVIQPGQTRVIDTGQKFSREQTIRIEVKVLQAKQVSS
ncbi:MAG: M48 family metalloprotease [Granulosicoccus sp.]